jgi:hypothetical protein
MLRMLIVSGAIGVLCACAPENATSSMQARYEANQGSHALTAEQCTFFSEDDKVTVCHATSSTKHPYVPVHVSVNGCINGHAGHERDYIGADDEMCLGGSCLDVGEPCDATLDCCDGSQCSSDGVCVPTTPACGNSGDACTTRTDCCSGLFCVSGTCGAAG